MREREKGGEIGEEGQKERMWRGSEMKGKWESQGCAWRNDSHTDGARERRWTSSSSKEAQYKAHRQVRIL